MPREALQLAGYLRKGPALTGPTTVQVDLTGTEGSEDLPFPTCLALLDELRSMDTQEIRFSGRRDPLAHPQAWELLSAALQRGFRTSLHTDFSQVDTAGVEQILERGIHETIVSLSTSDEGLEDRAARLRTLNDRKTDRPVTRLQYALTGPEDGQITAAFSLAEELGFDELEFTLHDAFSDPEPPSPSRTEAAPKLLEELKPLLGRAPWRTPRLLDGESLTQRLDSLALGERSDLDLVHETPCLVGWTSARVLADGAVLPCLRGLRIPSGNLHEQDFSSTWNGEAQARFRRAARSLAKDGDLFSKVGREEGPGCGCEIGCGNLAENRHSAGRLRSLTRLERTLLRRGVRMDRPETAPQQEAGP
ncbi:MAG: SPASM domain-containing protein [Myxococcota bacterium]|nr:SPASM domain-containing protein [Myxococcota bacterium]